MKSEVGEEAKEADADPMDGITAGMSALQFVPHSIYARGRGRGRGQGN